MTSNFREGLEKKLSQALGSLGPPLLLDYCVLFVCLFPLLYFMMMISSLALLDIKKLKSTTTFSSVFLHPLTPRSDQYVNYPYNFNTLSSRQAMTIKKIIN